MTAPAHEDAIDFPCSAGWLDYYQRRGISDGLPDEYFREAALIPSSPDAALSAPGMTLLREVQTLQRDNKVLQRANKALQNRVIQLERRVYQGRP